MPHVAAAPESEPVQNVDTHMDAGLLVDTGSPAASGRSGANRGHLAPGPMRLSMPVLAIGISVKKAGLLLRCRKGCHASAVCLCWAVAEP